MKKPMYCQRGHYNRWYTDKSGRRSCTECQKLTKQKSRLLKRIERLSQELIWDREFFDKGEYEFIDKGNNPQGSELHGEYLIREKENWIRDVANELEEICIELESPLERRKLTQAFYDEKLLESVKKPEPDFVDLLSGNFAPEPNDSDSEDSEDD